MNAKCEITITIGAIASQLRGDCDRLDCDVQGQVVDVDDPSDIYNDGKPCSFDICEQGKVANKAFPDGFGCPETGSGVCFASACVDGADGVTACGNGQVCAYTTCVPMHCDDFVFQPALGETDFDGGGPCRPCSALGNCSGDQDCADGVRNGEETGIDLEGLQAVRDALWAKGARLPATVRAGVLGGRVRGGVGR